MRNLLFALGLLGAAGIAASPIVNVAAAGQRSAPSAARAPYTAPAQASFNGSQRPAAGISGNSVVQFAMKYLGYPYTAVGNSPSTGFSCIGFVSYVYQSLGINLPDDLGGAMAFAPSISFANLEPGDVLYFQNTVWAGLSHVAIYIGGGKFIQAEWYGRGVDISSFTNDPVDGNYWSDHYLGANRPWTTSGNIAGIAVPTPASTTTQPVVPSVPVAPRQTIGRAAVVRLPAINVRSRPSYGAPIDTVITRGTPITILGHRRGWYRVSLASGTVGWVIRPGVDGGYRAPRSVAHVYRRSTTITIRRAAVRRRGLLVRALGTAAVRVNGLRVHSGPALGASLTSTVNVGVRLPVLRRHGQWLLVRLAAGRTGWIDGRFVTSTVFGIGSAVSTSRRTIPVMNRTVTTAVHVRAQPSLAGAILSLLAPGESYGVLYRAGYWARIRTDAGTTGWIDTAVVSSRGSTPAVTRHPTVTSTASYARTSRVALNVRRQPALGAAIISIIPPGGGYRTLGAATGWTHVQLANGSVGWVNSAVLTGHSTAAVSATGRTGSTQTQSSGTSVARSVVTAGVRVHTRPGVHAPTIRLLGAGSAVQVLRSTAGWTEVRVPGRGTGYVLGVYVKTTAASSR